MSATLQPFAVPFGLLVVGAARTIPLVWSVPVFGGPAFPWQLRLAFGAGMAWLSWPLLAGRGMPETVGAWIMLVTREILVGVVMGFACAAVFRAAEAAGGLMDVARGGMVVSIPGPGAEEGTSTPVGVLLLLLACTIFCQIDGLGHVAVALARSYEAIPIAAPLSVAPTARGAALLAVAASGKLIESVIALAAPVLLALLLADLVLGVVGRLVPGIPVCAHALPLKALLGLAAVLVALAGIDLAIAGRVGDFFGLLDGAFRQWL